MGDDLTEADFDAAKIDEVRAAVREIQQREGLSNAMLARESGVASSTLAAVLAGSYAGNVPAQALKLRRWLTARAAGAVVRQQTARGPGYVQTMMSEQFVLTMEHCQFAPDFGVIVGEPGIGKTTTAAEYTSRGHNAWMVTVHPTGGTPTQLINDIAEVVSIPTLGFHTASEKAKVLCKRLRGSGGLIIVDEAQNLSTPALDQLRTIHDLAEIGIVMMGNRKIFMRLEGGARAADYAQLYSRVGMRVDKRKPYAEDIEMLLDAWGLQDKSARRIARAVARRPGALRAMTKVLRQALLRANAGDGVVTEQMMLAAAQQLGGDRPLEMDAA